MRRLMAVLGLALAFGVLGAGAASAAPSIAGPPPPTTGNGPSLNPLDGIGSAIMDKLCPQRKAPYPQSPELPVVARGGGPGTYATRGYAGTFWTTYDAGCLSMDKTDTAIGTEIETVATTVDGLTNELQILALSPSTTANLDRTIATGLKGLHDAFWTPWAGVGMVLAGCVIGLAMWTGRVSDAGSAIVRALVVVTVVVGVVSTPALIFKAADGVTSGVAAGVAGSLMKTTPNAGMPAGATPQQKFAEGFYQLTYRSWLDGAFCSDTDAAKRYGARLLADQSFTVAEVKGGATAAMVKAKQADWAAVGKEMAKTNPAGFSCWKGATDSRTGAAIRHAVVSLSVGFWVNLGSLGLLALKFLLRIAALFLVTFGALALFSERVADRMAGLALTGLLGPPFVAMGVGTILWAYYALMLDPGQAWWQSGILAFAMGLGLWLAKGLMQSLFSSLSHVSSRGGRYGRRAGRRFMAYSQRSNGMGHTAAAAAAGGAAGAVIATAARGAAGSAVAAAGHTTDSRREITMDSEDRQQSVDSRRTQTDTPDSRAVGYYMGQARATAAAKAAREGSPVPTPGPAPVAPVRREVPAPLGTPETRAPQMEHGSQRDQHAPMTEKRHDNWRREAMAQRSAQDDAAHAKAAPVVSQTFAGADSRRADLPE